MPDMRPCFAAVVLDKNLTKPLDYAVPIEMQDLIQIGMRVEVPFRTSIQKATVVELKTTSSIPTLKSIAKLIHDHPFMSKPLWNLAQWISSYYCAPLQKTLRCFIPPNARKETQPKKEIVLSLNLSKEKTASLIAELRNNNPLHATILEKLLHSNRGISASTIIKELQISRAPLQTLIARKWIRPVKTSEFDLSEEDFFPSLPKLLNEEQRECLSTISLSLDAKRFAAHLIHGVTGSGKTEIYLQAIAQTLQQGRTAIMLVPEIALTSQTIERFRSRFQEKIAIWHHRRSLGERTLAWEELRTQKAQIVIGARSAIFCPAQNVGLIIVDEEHDSSYKQSEETPCYNGRDVSVMRAYYEQATVILGSATPSIESKYNAEIGKYILSNLHTRATSALMPTIRIVDMKREYEIYGGFTHFSSELIEGLKKRIEEGEQALLFLNRRGYHRLQICASCRTVVKCPHCDLGLTFHKASHHLKCHLCDYTQDVPRICPSCSSPESLQFKGFGTEHVERALHALLPGVRTLRMDRDTTRQKESHEELYRQFRSHKADVLIGTQMIAKGFHFPAVTLVGVLQADSALSIPDFRSSETVFQLITQVAGRSGRSKLPGEVILQTLLPNHPILQLAAAQDYESFYKRELEERRMFSYPPFCHLVKMTFSGDDPQKTEAAALELHTKLQERLAPGMELLPVIAAGHAKVKDRYRFQFIVKTQRISVLQKIVQSISFQSRYKIDVDTISTFF